MKYVDKIYNFLETSEIEYLNELSKNFITDVFQIYHTKLIKDDELISFKNRINKYVHENYGERYIINGVWINKVKDDENGVDNFHVDKSDLSIVTYFNTNFEGGDFEYILDSKRIKIKPEINLSIIMDDKIKHRITKVKNGERFSLVAFFNISNEYDKKIKSLL